jgi:hypothetical protein
LSIVQAGHERSYLPAEFFIFFCFHTASIPWEANIRERKTSLLVP